MEEKYKIHATHIASTLISIIIILITIKWGDIPKLVEYITFSLSITSLVLGILQLLTVLTLHLHSFTARQQLAQRQGKYLRIHST